MDKDMVDYKRKSYIEVDELYFWTSTINNSALVRVPTNQRCERNQYVNLKHNGQGYG